MHSWLWRQEPRGCQETDGEDQVRGPCCSIPCTHLSLHLSSRYLEEVKCWKMIDFLSRECSMGLVLSSRLANSRTRFQFPYGTQGRGGTEALLRGPLTPAICEVRGAWELEGARKRQPGPKHSSCSWLRGQPLNKELSVPSQRTKTWSTRCGPSDVKKCHIWPKQSMHQSECPGTGSSWATF